MLATFCIKLHCQSVGNPPQMEPINFLNQSYYLAIEESNITLTTKISTSHDFPLDGINWTKNDHSLPPTAKVTNYTIDGELYSNLSVYNLSYNDDGGQYTCTASNECGTSFVFASIAVKKGSYGNFLHC